jgi:hypothetical protein
MSAQDEGDACHCKRYVTFIGIESKNILAYVLYLIWICPLKPSFSPRCLADEDCSTFHTYYPNEILDRILPRFPSQPVDFACLPRLC